MSSILTNSSAMVALQTLKGINMGLEKTQSEISTGKSIGSAKDNAAIWAISKVMETDKSSFKVIQDQLSVAESTLSVGTAGAEQVVSLLTEMKDLAAGATNDTADFAKIQTDIANKQAQIASVVNASQFNGIALLKTDIGNGGATYEVLSSLDRTSGSATTTASKIAVTGPDFEANIVGATVTAIADKATAETAIGEIEALLEVAINGAAALGSAGKRVSDQNEFVGKLSDAISTGIGSLVDADMEEASARLQALQTQQQLGIQALSIANSSPQNILSLFR